MGSGCEEKDIAFYCDTGIAAKMMARYQAQSKGTRGTKYALGSYDAIKREDPQLIEIGDSSMPRNPCSSELGYQSLKDWVDLEPEPENDGNDALPVGAIVGIALTG